MNQFAIKFKWVAIAFAVITLFGAYVFINGQADTGAPDAGTPAPPAPQVAQNAAPTPEPPATEEADDAAFDDDSSLLDEASGEDPTPPDDNGGDNSNDGGFADSGSDSNSTISDQPPQFTADGTAIVPGNS